MKIVIFCCSNHPILCVCVWCDVGERVLGMMVRWSRHAFPKTSASNAICTNIPFFIWRKYAAHGSWSISVNISLTRGKGCITMKLFVFGAWVNSSTFTTYLPWYKTSNCTMLALNRWHAMLALNRWHTWITLSNENDSYFDIRKKYHKLMGDVYCHYGYSIPLTFGKIVGGGGQTMLQRIQ